MTREEAKREMLFAKREVMKDSWIDKAYDVAISALEQPEIIRCKDCKHSEHWYRDKSRCFLWHEEGIDVFEDGYCSYAERKEGETE